MPALAQGLGQGQAAPTSAVANSECLPATTTSAEAAKLFAEGLRLRYNFHTEQALDKFREATRQDPNFASAWAYLVLLGTDPEEVKRAGDRAQQAAQNASAGEELLVKWVTSAEAGHFLEAITAMNDLLGMCPHDAPLNYEAGVWVRSQGDRVAAVRFTQRALDANPDFAGALNTLAYQLAFLRRYDEAIPHLERYIALEPNDPNPHDSMAEILQWSGRLEESLAEYREALQLDPTFVSSQEGLGNDYALLGNQDRAREEYAKALKIASTPQEKLDAEIQSAITWVREGNANRSREELTRVLREAEKLRLSDYQSLIHHNLALLAGSPASAFQQLDAADAALRQTTHVSGATRTRLLARSLQLRAQRAVEFHKLAAARDAVAQLQKMLQANPSDMVERAYRGAHGALLAAEKKTSAAIEELREDPENPASLAKLAELQAASGNAADAAETRAILKGDYSPTLQDWLVARRYRP
jgi:tetratricopeptide (TPR) repeat protein